MAKKGNFTKPLFWGGVGGVYSIRDMYSISCMAVVVKDHRPSHPYNAGTEHVEFSPTRQTLLARSAVRRWREDGGSVPMSCMALVV